MLSERDKHLEILRKMFTKDVNYQFNGKEAVPFESFLKKVLSNAERKYSDDYYWRKVSRVRKFFVFIRSRFNRTRCLYRRFRIVSQYDQKTT